MKSPVFNLILGALPLLIYPMIFMASIMSLAAIRAGDEISLLMLASNGFLLTSLAYPLVYFISLFGTIIQKNKDNAKRWSLIPLKYLLIVIVLMLLWMLTEETYNTL